MKITINKGRAVGSVTAPSSKSMAHRLLISAALAEGESRVHGVPFCDDVLATIDCLTALGAKFTVEGDTVRVIGTNPHTAAPTSALSCRESGSTLRFMVPVCLLCDKNIMLTGSPSLMRRPMGAYEALSRDKGFTFLHDENSVILRGPLSAGNYKIAGDVSSQFITGLLFALPIADGDSTLDIIPPVVSRPYIDLTLSALKDFGIEIKWSDDHTLFIRGNQKYQPREVTVEGDYSGAAFLEALNAIGGEVEIKGLRPDSLQGDRVYQTFYRQLERGIPTIHIADCPDLGPILFALAAAKHGGIFTGTSRLRFKESDRAECMAEELKKFGTSVIIREDSVTVYPADFHAPAETLLGHNDHRIVMSLAVLLTLTGGTIEGAEAISKSFPDFFSDLGELGIEETIYEN